MILEKLASLITAGVMLASGGMNVALPDKDIDGTLFLINRTHSVSKNYVPETRKVNGPGLSQSMRDDAASALESMMSAGKKDGVNLTIVSGFRSYSKQSSIYARKVHKTHSEEKADELVARPGTSEHQLGLAMDLGKKNATNLTAGFGATAEGKWLVENAWRFGFIVRYPEGSESITGYSYEPWHVRYFGKPLAKKIHESGVPYETFLNGYKMGVYEYLVFSALND